jgi:hypothetical protein
MSRYRHHKYTWSKPFGFTRHWWELVGPDGAIHFHVSISESYSPSCGLEIHRTTPADYQCGEAPSHVDCPLTWGRCWHDGTSLYASEELWPMIESMLRAGDHPAIFRLLEGEADRRFEYDTERGQ